MALDGDLTKDVEKALGEIKTAMRSKFDELEQQAKKRGEDAVTKAEAKAINDALDKLKDDIKAELKKKDDEINALHRKANRPAVASSSDPKIASLETKANLEFGRWVTPQGQKVDATKAGAARLEYAAAFDAYLRKGEKGLSDLEAKALSVGSAPDGGYFVEPFRSQQIIDKLYETSALRAVASVISITSKSVEFPIDRDEVTTGWVGEQSSRPETNTPQVGMLEIPVHELYAMPKSTQNLLDDAGFNVEAWLDQKVADQMGREENAAFVNGNGVKQPKGFASYATAATADASRAFGTLEHVETGANGAFRTASATVSPADDLLDLIYKFKPGYRGSLRWGGPRVTLGAVRKFKDQQGNYIYDPRLGANGIIDTVLGYPWDEFSDMAAFTVTDALGIVLADWKRGYQIVDRQGIRQLRDPYTSKGYVLFYTTKRVGGGVMDSDAIKFVKFT
jgi:HK97 family phage major capsid protein